MALAVLVKSEYFQNLPLVVVAKVADNFYRYTDGSYGSYNEAKQELLRFGALGYSSAYVSRSN